jgi:uncharacterized protein (DUF952 family)
VILHLLPRWIAESLDPGDAYLPSTFAADGFIHCSPSDEVMLAVANRFYADGDDELVVWTVDEDALVAEVRWEPPDHGPQPGVPDDVRFPHVYGPIDVRAVVGTRGLVRGPAGGPAFVGYAPVD